MVKPSTAYRDDKILKLRKRYEAKEIAVMLSITIQQVYNATRRVSDRRKEPRGGRRAEDEVQIKAKKGKRSFS